MASLVYLSCIEDEAKGAIDFDSDSFKVMLVGPGYTPDRFAHTRRSHISNEVAGVGYVAGGAAVTVTVVRDEANNRIDVSLGGAVWPLSVITDARAAVYYKSRGGGAASDELVAVNHFDDNKSTTNGTFTLNASTLRIS